MIEFLAEESRSREPDRIAYFDVSYELLAAMLKLPEDAEVVLADSYVAMVMDYQQRIVLAKNRRYLQA